MAVKNHTEEVDFRRLPILSHDVICIVGFDGAFREINPAGEKTLGFTTKELADKPYLEFVHPGDQSTTATQIQHAMTGEDITTFENRMVLKDSQSKQILWKIIADRPRRLLYAVGSQCRGSEFCLCSTRLLLS